MGSLELHHCTAPKLCIVLTVHGALPSRAICCIGQTVTALHVLPTTLVPSCSRNFALYLRRVDRHYRRHDARFSLNARVWFARSLSRGPGRHRDGLSCSHAAVLCASIPDMVEAHCRTFRNTAQLLGTVNLSQSFACYIFGRRKLWCLDHPYHRSSRPYA